MMEDDSSVPAMRSPGVVKTRTASDGYPLHYRHWIPSKPTRGWMLTLHGIQSHSGWYEFSGKQFADAGWNVRMPDRRGSGLNTQQRGDACHWQRLVHDVRHFLFDMHREREQSGVKAPILISGISWGGKLALLIAREYPGLVDGVALITPGIFSKIGPSLFNRARIGLARALDLRERRVPIPLSDAALFTTQMEQQAFIKTDPLALHDMTLSFLFASMDLDEIAQRPQPIAVPMQLMLAEEDGIIDNQRTQQFLQQLAKSSCSVMTYPGARHTLELDHCREEFVRDWIDWAGTIRSAQLEP